MKKNIILFLLGYHIYALIEVLWRGYTHWTMAITGGLCLVLLNAVFVKMGDRSIWLKCLVGSLTITGVEFVVGCIVNLLLGWHVWDYSGLPLNILGQVCLLFSLAWYLLSIPIWLFSRFIERHLPFQEHIHHQ